jgi:hypothetical protein
MSRKFKIDKKSSIGDLYDKIATSYVSYSNSLHHVIVGIENRKKLRRRWADEL